MKIHGFETVDKVERIHGWKFAKVFLRNAVPSEATIEGFGASGILTYPDDDEAAREQFDDLEDEIVTITFARARRAIIEAFITTANEVLERERTESNV